MGIYTIQLHPPWSTVNKEWDYEIPYGCSREKSCQSLHVKLRSEYGKLHTIALDIVWHHEIKKHNYLFMTTTPQVQRAGFVMTLHYVLCEEVGKKPPLKPQYGNTLSCAVCMKRFNASIEDTRCLTFRFSQVWRPHLQSKQDYLFSKLEQ